MTHVELKHLTYTYDAHPALADLSLEIGSGELAAVLGPSGCGKTTTLRLLAGLLRPTVGDVRFDGHSVLDTAAERRGAVMVFQQPLLFPHLSVFENVAFGLRAQKQSEPEIRRAVTEILARVQLEGLERRRPRELSGGQAQRVALARALVIRPRVLLLDEPLSSLDPHLRDEMRGLIRELHDDLGLTTVLVTHDQHDAALLADRIAVLFDGRLAQHAALRDFFDRPVSRAVARFFGGVNFVSGELRGGVLETDLGRLAVADARCADGPVVATIRPEAVRWLGPERGRTIRCNEVLGKVERIVDLGAARRLIVKVGACRLEAQLGADDPVPTPGTVGGLGLPAERLWLLPEPGLNGSAAFEPIEQRALHDRLDQPGNPAPR